MSKKGFIIGLVTVGLLALGSLLFIGGDVAAGDGQVYSHRVQDSTITNTDLVRGTLDSTRIGSKGLGWKCFDDSVIEGHMIVPRR